jgi:polyhydroxyalkanoate synthase
MKRNYWSNSIVQKASVKNAGQWIEGAQLHAGSWWPEWSAFLAEHAGKKVKVASKLGSAKYKVIEPAPGRYVKTPC